MATPTESIQQLYIAYFNRPADVGGLNFWLDSVAKGVSLETISTQFAADAEYKAEYGGLNADAVVARVYQNLFNRAPDPTGLDFWSTGLRNGTYTVEDIVAEVSASALQDPTKGADFVAVDSKIDAAIAFTDYLKTDINARLAYATGSSNGVAKAYIAGVTNAATLAAAIAPANLAAVGGNVIDGGAGVGGTFNLGAAVDTLPGTAGNDTFNALTINPASGAAADTLTTFDSITGGAGKDVLNIYSDNVNNKVQAGTVTGVETINIYSTTAAYNSTKGAINAGAFAGATTVTQYGLANDVSGLAATTTAGFNGLSLLDTVATVADTNVAAAGASATIALTDVKGNAATNVVYLSASGSALTSVNVSGNMLKNTGVATAAKLDLTATAAKDASTFTLNTSLKTTLHVNEGAGSTKDVTTVNAAASTGGITFSADNKTTTVTTGSGNDVLTVISALNTTSKAASVVAGAGDDDITINVTGTASAGNTATVDGGDGDDTIDVTIAANVKYTVNGGAGDDTIALTGTVGGTDVVDGGAGTDIIAIDGQATYVADDYIVYTKVLKNFEGLEFTTTAVGTAFTTGDNLDASKLAQYKDFILDAGGFVTEVAADQTLTTGGDLHARAAGYVIGSAVTYAGTLNAVVVADAAVEAAAKDVVLTVEAETAAGGADVAATLTGDAKTAVVHLAHGENTTTEVFTVATLNLDVAATTAGGAPDAFKALTSLTIDGNGSAVVTNVVGTSLVTIDASGLNSVNEDGDAVAGLSYTSASTKAETVKLGGGIDTIVLTSSTYGAIDTVTGLNLVLDGTTLDAAVSDKLTVNAGAVFEKFTTTQTDLDLALRDAAQSTVGDNLVFKMGSDTYVFIDAGTAGQVDAADTVVKLTGTINLDALVQALA